MLSNVGESITMTQNACLFRPAFIREQGAKFTALGEERERDEKDEFVIKNARENQVGQGCQLTAMVLLWRHHITGQSDEGPGEATRQGGWEIHNWEQDDSRRLCAPQPDARPQDSSPGERRLPKARISSALKRSRHID